MSPQTVSMTESLAKLSDAKIRQLTNQVGRNIRLDRIQELMQEVEPAGFAELQFIQVQKELIARGMPL